MTRFGDDGIEVHVPLSDHEQDLVLSWAARTDVGHRRAANEDSVLVGLPIFAVADGMGGHAAGDRASAAVAELAALEQAFIDAGTAIDALAEGIPIGVGTTITGAALVNDGPTPSFLVFNIGDSRVYRFERNELTQVTIDHSVVQELVDAGVLAPEMADSHPESNVITRALGFHDEPLPDIWRVPVRAGMRLLICSDGLTKEVGDDRLRLHLASGMPAAETASALVDAALAAGGRDNVTLIVVDVLEAPRPQSTAKHDTQATQEHQPAAPDLGRPDARPPSGGNPG